MPPNELMDMQAWVDENGDKAGAAELGKHLVVLLDYLVQFEKQSDEKENNERPD